MAEEVDAKSLCRSSDSEQEISSQDSWRCTECGRYNIPLRICCVRCCALRENWYEDVPQLIRSMSDPTSRSFSFFEEDCDDADTDVPNLGRTLSGRGYLTSHSTSGRPLPTAGKSKDPGRRSFNRGKRRSGRIKEMEKLRPRVLKESCVLCGVRRRNGLSVHGRSGHLLTCVPCARRLYKSNAPCPGCGKPIQKVVKIV